MGAVFVEWLNVNEQRNYPLHDLANREARDGRVLPNDILVDAHIWLPKSAGAKVFVSSVSVSPVLITMTFAAAPFDPFCSSSILPTAFVPLAALRVNREHTPFRNYPLEAIYPGVGGWVALGACDDMEGSYSLVFDSPLDTVLLDRTVHAYNDIPVLSAGKLGVLPKLTGTIRLQGVSGQIKTFATTKVIDGVLRRVAAIGLDKTNALADNLALFAGDCGHRPQAGNCSLAPITDINGLTPDCDGNINVKFVGDIVAGAIQPGGIILDHPIGLAQVCAAKAGFNPLPGEDHDDYCEKLPEPSSSSVPEPSSSSLPSESSSSSGSLVPQNCEYFDGPVGPFTVYNQLTVVKPTPPSAPFEWSVELYGDGYHAATALGYAQDQYMLNLVKYLTLNPAMVRHLSAKVRPMSEQQNAVILFGHPGIGYELGFYFFGLSLRRTSAYPNGKFFFGMKGTKTYLTDPDVSLGYGYVFSPSEEPVGKIWDPGAEMPVTEYNVHVKLSRSGIYTVAQAWVDWLDSANVPQSFYTAIPAFVPKRVQGYAGFGAVSSDTLYNAVGVDCIV